MHIQSTNKCLDNTWKGSENKESCCCENLSCCHIPSIVHCSFSMSQRDLNKGIYNGQVDGGTGKPETSV